MSDETPSVDPEFEELVKGFRAELKAAAVDHDAKLKEITERFFARAPGWKPRNLPGVEVRDYKQAQAGDS
jgi:hypothetical protein